MNRLVNPAVLPDPIGFSHAVESTGSRTLHIAGQIGSGADGIVVAGFVEQFGRALANVARCMDEAAFPRDSLVRMLIYTTDMDAYRSELKPLGEAYRAVFGNHYPAMALFGVAELFDPAARLELVATAQS